MAPSVGAGVVDRPRLEARLDDGARLRLTLVIAGPGFGKSTLLAGWALARPGIAWLSMDSRDRRLASLATGIAGALGAALDQAPAELPGGGAGGGDDELAGAEALAGVVSQWLSEHLEEDLVLVLEDLHEAAAEPGPLRFVERLVRAAPPMLHVVISSRTPITFAIERLRGQGQVFEVTPEHLAFEPDETAAVLEVLSRDAAGLAPAVHAATNGWPAAVRIAVETLREAPPPTWPAIVARIGKRSGPLFGYVAEEVLDREPSRVRELLRLGALFPWFDAELLAAVGLADAREILADVARRAFFIRYDASDGTHALHGLVREAVLVHLPLAPDAAAEVHRRAAAWHLANDRPAPALAQAVASGDMGLVRRRLSEGGFGLIGDAGPEAVRSAIGAIRDAGEELGPELEIMAGDAAFVAGDWAEAIEAYRAAGGGRSPAPAAAAWRLGVIHHERGELDLAQAAFAAADLEAGPPTDAALALAGLAYTRWNEMDPATFRPLVDRVVALATTAGSDQALAAAGHLEGIAASLEGDVAETERHLALAAEAADRAHDALRLIRIRSDQAYFLLAQGRFDEALAALDAAIEVAGTLARSPFLALALSDRSQVLTSLGRFEEAIADAQASRRIYDRAGSAWVAWPLSKEGHIRRLLGDDHAARIAYEASIEAAERLGDPVVLSDSLAGLAEAVAEADPGRATQLAARAVEVISEDQRTDARLAAARVALRTGDRTAARGHAERLQEPARRLRDLPALAGILEVLAATEDDPAVAEARLDEAGRIWQELGSPYGVARHQLVRARVLEGSEAQVAAAAAEAAFQAMGARTMAAQAAARLATIRSARHAGPSIQSFGGFRVLRAGEPVALTEWQSKKARDLLKILVARRGRPISREAMCEALWPGEDPEPLANRLSVALTTLRTVLDPDRALAQDHFVRADKTTLALEIGRLAVDLEAFHADAAEGRSRLRRGDDAAARQFLATAEGTYLGPFLEEDPAEDWAAAPREQAAAEYVWVARSLAALVARNGDIDGAIRLQLRILESDPYDEPAHLDLAALLTRVGRHGEARRRYALYAERMAEIGVEAAAFPLPDRVPALVA